MDNPNTKFDPTSSRIDIGKAVSWVLFAFSILLQFGIDGVIPRLSLLACSILICPLFRNLISIPKKTLIPAVAILFVYACCSGVPSDTTSEANSNTAFDPDYETADVSDEDLPVEESDEDDLLEENESGVTVGETKNENGGSEKTAETERQEYTELQELFLEIDESWSKDILDSYLSESNFYFGETFYKASGTYEVKITMNQDDYYSKLSKEERIQIEYTEDGTLEYVKYSNQVMLSAIYYNPLFDPQTDENEMGYSGCYVEDLNEVEYQNGVAYDKDTKYVLYGSKEIALARLLE